MSKSNKMNRHDFDDDNYEDWNEDSENVKRKDKMATRRQEHKKKTKILDRLINDELNI